MLSFLKLLYCAELYSSFLILFASVPRILIPVPTGDPVVRRLNAKGDGEKYLSQSAWSRNSDPFPR
jgi:hypothetical protein